MTQARQQKKEADDHSNSKALKNFMKGRKADKAETARILREREETFAKKKSEKDCKDKIQLNEEPRSRRR